MNPVSMNDPFTTLGQQQTPIWRNMSGVTQFDALVLPSDTFNGTQDLGRARVSLVPSPLQKGPEFLQMIYLLRNSYRQSDNPSDAEIMRLEHATGLPDYQISAWFDGEREQRDWIARNSLPTPQTTQTFTSGALDRCYTSRSRPNTPFSRIPIPSYPKGYVLPVEPTQMNTEPQPSDAGPALPLCKRHRGVETSQKSYNISQTSRKKPRCRQQSDSHHSAAENGTFSCPTCRNSSKTETAWRDHQKRNHFPTTIYICGGADGKTCQLQPCKRKDNFANHLVKTHGFPARSEELKSEVKKRAVKIIEQFHEKCGFCMQDLHSWGASMNHIWDHVEGGVDVSEWRHVCATDHELQVGDYALQLSDDSQENDDDFDKDGPNDDDPNSSGGGHNDSSHFEPFGDYDDLDFGTGFDAGYYDYGSGQGHHYDSSQNHHHQIMFSDSEVDIITRSLGQAQASGRHQSPKSLEYVKTLGRGGFGRVDEVSCKDLQQNFALKIIRRSVGGANSSSEFSIFKNEVEILKSLVHPHIVQFAGSHTFRNSFSILMHPVVDGNLAAFLRDVDLDAHRVPLETFNSMTPLYRLWTLMRCLASAVSYMHSINIVHGDLKPENVLIDGDQIFLTDFGSAKKLSNGKQSLETTYTLSPEFSAPETIESGNKDKPGDIWSFGCILVLVATRSAGLTLDDFERYRSFSGGKRSFSPSLKKTLEWLDTLQERGRSSQTFGERTTYELIRRMISEEPDVRPPAEEVYNLLPINERCQCNPQSSSVVTRAPAVVTKSGLKDHEKGGAPTTIEQIKACLEDPSIYGRVKRDRLVAIASGLGLEASNKPWCGHVLALLCESFQISDINKIMTHGHGVYKKEWDRWEMGEGCPSWENKSGEDTIRNLVDELLMDDLIILYKGCEVNGGARVKGLSIRDVCKKVEDEIGIVAIKQGHLWERLKLNGVAHSLKAQKLRVEDLDCAKINQLTNHDKLKDDMETLQQKFDNLDAIAQRLKNSNGELHSKVLSLQSETFLGAEHISDLQKSLEKLNNENSELKTDLSTFHKHNDSLRTEVEKLQIGNNQPIGKLEKIEYEKPTFERALAALQQQKKNLQNDIDRLQAVNAELHDQVSQLQEANTSLNETIDLVQNENESLQGKKNANDTNPTRQSQVRLSSMTIDSAISVRGEKNTYHINPTRESQVRLSNWTIDSTIGESQRGSVSSTNKRRNSNFDVPEEKRQRSLDHINEDDDNCLPLLSAYGLPIRIVSDDPAHNKERWI